MPAQRLYFRVDGEFITQTAREWFWVEDRPYKTALKLLTSCMDGTDLSDIEKESIARDILEYKKKFVGVNSFSLVNDTLPTRPISEKISEYELREKTRKVKDKMELYPGEFLDPYSVLKSIKNLDETIENEKLSPEDIIDYFRCPYEWTKDSWFDEYTNEPTKAGLWLLDRPKLVAQIFIKLNSENIDDKFWHEIYKQTKNNDGFKMRNKKYEAEQSIKTAKEDVTVKTYNPCGSASITEPIEPDDINLFSGLVSPEGHWYSCDFGGHTALAYKIYITNHLGVNKIKYDLKASDEQHRLISDRALDVLIDNEWIAIRYLYGTGHYFTYKTDLEPTENQINKIWKAIVKHDAHNVQYPDFLLN